jgi:hypothetical protein
MFGIQATALSRFSFSYNEKSFEETAEDSLGVD